MSPTLPVPAAGWECKACTYINREPHGLVCEICSVPRGRKSLDIGNSAASAISVDDNGADDAKPSSNDEPRSPVARMPETDVVVLDDEHPAIVSSAISGRKRRRRQRVQDSRKPSARAGKANISDDSYLPSNSGTALSFAIDLTGGTPLLFAIDLTGDSNDEFASLAADNVVSDDDLARMLQRQLHQTGSGLLSLRQIQVKQRQAERDRELARSLQREEEEKVRKQRRNPFEAQDMVLAQRIEAEERNELEKRRQAVEARTDDLFDVLADHRKNIHSWLRKNGSFGQPGIAPVGFRFNVTNVAENPHSKPGMPLYNRFVAAWERVADQTVVLGFHGTPEANVESICRTGLDPKRRRGQAMGPGEYFATNAQTSLAFCGGGRKMLVVALLMDKSGLTAGGNGGTGVIVVNKPEHQLPLFVITF